MKVLGVSFDYHDAAAALVIDGQIVAAETEERFSRVKHDPGLPSSAIEFCLSKAGLKPNDLDRVVFYEDTRKKFDRILSFATAKDAAALDKVMRVWVNGDKFFPEQRLAHYLDIDPKKVTSVDHHMAHAASAFFCSPFQEAIVVTLDGVGEYHTASVCRASDGNITRIFAQELPHSLGLFYSAFTAFLGFRINEGEYKVMGMAGFGKPNYLDDILAMFELSPRFGFRLDQKCFDFALSAEVPFNGAFIEKFGPARTPESPFDVNEDGEIGTSSRHYANIAASVQRATEIIILDFVKKALQDQKTENLCMAGGVALNSLANARIKQELGANLYVQPAAGDAGGALGAAYLAESPALLARRSPMTSALLGLSFEDSHIRDRLHGSMKRRAVHFETDEALLAVVVDRLATGHVIGWFQGRAEWGPRALGCRSILANPMLPDMQAKVNRLIKFREPFRPFAPSVIADRAHEFFEVDPEIEPWDPEFFMLSVVKVLPHKRALLPAITHVDGTARIQRVSKTVNPLYYELIHGFGERTGVPVLLNTSFNLRGEPIVGSPEDAVATFGFSGLDYLVMGRTMIGKSTPKKGTAR